MNDDNDKKIQYVTAQPLTDDETEIPKEDALSLELLEDTETRDKKTTPTEEVTDNASVQVISDASKEERIKQHREEEKKLKEEERRKKEEEEVEQLKAAIAEQAREDERPQSSSFTLRKILGGDILWTSFFRHNIGLMIMIVFIIIIYISNRYSVQKDLIEIDKLNHELEDAKYRALSSSSQLTEKTRESHILELLKDRKDSILKMPDRPPYKINVPDK